MAQTVSDYLIERLYEWGIRRIYGYPGDGINGIMGALGRAEDKVEFIQARHEEIAAFEACAHAKFTGHIGVCLATSGPGAIHLLNGLYDARMDHQPVVAIVGQQAVTALGSDYQQEVDLISLFKDVARDFVHMVSTPEQMRHVVDRALRIAKAERTVTCIIIPNDVQEMPAAPSPNRTHGVVYSGIGYHYPIIVPKESDLDHAARILNHGERVAILVGAGAMNAVNEVEDAADLLGAGVAKALLGKATLGDDMPYVTGSIGLLGTEPSWTMMQDCDTLLMIGTGFPYSEFLPPDGKVRAVQIDIKARQLGSRYPTDVNLHGDSRATLRELLPRLKYKRDREWQESIVEDMKNWWDVLEARAMADADPINPQRLFWELSPRLPENVIVTCDSGSAANWWARDLRFRRGMMGSLSGNLATMCPAVPYAIAAKFAHPNRPVIATVGDGAMQMLGNAALIGVSKYWEEWEDPRLVVLVLNNLDLNQVTWEQRVMNGDPKFECSQDVPDMNYAEYAIALGLRGVVVDNPDDVGNAWDAALSADRPFVIDAHCDPNVPPLPPHISFEQAKGLMFSMLKGDVNRRGVMKQSARQILSRVFD